MCALNINCDDPCRCVTGWWEGSKRHEGTFQTWLLLFTTKWDLELSSVVSRRTSWCSTFLQQKWPGGQEVSTSKGLFPAWWSSSLTNRQNTLNNETLSPRGPSWDLCVCRCLAAKNYASMGFPHSSRNYEKLVILHFTGTGRRRKGLQFTMRLRKCPNAIFSWEKKRKNQGGRAHLSTHKLWHACWLTMEESLTPSPLCVCEAEPWLQSERTVRIPRNPVATVLKYESARPFFFPSLFFSVSYKLWSLPLPLIHALSKATTPSILHPFHFVFFQNDGTPFFFLEPLMFFLWNSSSAH